MGMEAVNVVETISLYRENESEVGWRCVSYGRRWLEVDNLKVVATQRYEMQLAWK
jgi:hypothetical protein